jgi:hypothetical protein
VELYLGASDENISEDDEQTCLPAFTEHLAEELRSLPSLTCLQLRYHDTIRASDIRTLVTLTGLTGLTALTIQGASMGQLLYPEDLENEDHLHLMEASRPVAIGELTSLTSLHLHGCSTYIAEASDFQHCLRAAGGPVGLQWRAPSLAKLTALTSLHIGGDCWDMNDEQTNLPALTYIHLGCLWISYEPDMRLWELASRLPGLTHLHLSGDSGDFSVSNDGLRAIASLAALTHLHLEGCRQVTNDGMLAIRSLPALTHLHLANCTQVSNDGLRAIASLTSLTELHLVHCPQVTNDGLRAIASLTSLTELHLVHCPQVTNDGLRAIASLTSLTELHLVHCPQVTNDGLRAIASLTSLTELHLRNSISWCDGRGGGDTEKPDGAEIAHPDGVRQRITRGDYGVAATARTGLAHAVPLSDKAVRQPASPSTCRSCCEVRRAADGVAAVAPPVTDEFSRFFARQRALARPRAPQCPLARTHLRCSNALHQCTLVAAVARLQGLHS